MISLLPLLIAAAPVMSDAPDAGKRASHVAMATVTIIQAEVVAATPVPSDITRTDRQYRQRGSVPMVEFF